MEHYLSVYIQSMKVCEIWQTEFVNTKTPLFCPESQLKFYDVIQSRVQNNFAVKNNYNIILSV